MIIKKSLFFVGTATVALTGFNVQAETTVENLTEVFENGGTLNFENDLTYSNQRFTTNGTDVTINGNGFSLTGEGSTSFTVAEGDRLNFSNITFTGYDRSGNSALLYDPFIDVNGTAGFDNITMSDNITVSSSTSLRRSSLISNKNEITSISGVFKNNHNKIGTAAHAVNIVIYNTGHIHSINGWFENNYAETEKGWALGAVIFNDKTIDTIEGTFKNNHVSNSWSNGFGSDASGGVMQNTHFIDTIDATFEDNYASNTLGQAHGGAYDSEMGQINLLKGTFLNNHVYGGQRANGGAVSINAAEKAYAGTIDGTFTGNYAETGSGQASGGAISLDEGHIENIYGKFNDNFVKADSGRAYGGAVSTFRWYVNEKGEARIDKIEADFDKNYVVSKSGEAFGGALLNDTTSTISQVIGSTFTGNYAESQEGVAQGGAVWNGGVMTITNSNFTDNYVKGETAQGGAIYNAGTMTLVADNAPVLISGNKANDKSNGVFMAETGILNLTADGGDITFNDGIDGVWGYKINIDGDKANRVLFNNDVFNADITLDNTNVIVDKAEYLGPTNNMMINSGNLTINSGVMSINNLGSNTLHFKNFAMPGGLLRVASVTVDLENQVSGMITADTASGGGDGKIKVENILLTTDGEEGSTPVQFVSSNISDEVTTDITEAMAPIYKYGVAYDAETGEFIFTRGDLIVPPSVPATPIIRPTGYKAYNPGIFANDVAAMAGLNVQGDIAKRVFDMDRNYEYCYGRVWAIPYYSDDTLNMSGFYDIDSTNYGLIAGVDTRSFGNYNGWNSVYTIFGAYNDGENKYRGVNVDTKSWLVGLKASVFNGGFYGDALINYAWHDSDEKTAFGKDSVDTTGYGAAVKAGYKHDFANRVSVDGSVMLSWQQVEGKGFTSKSGARFDTDDYSRLSLVPQIKVGYNLRDIRPYALARYNFALSEDGSTTVNNSLALPEIESKDYVEYGLGIETTTSFPHSGYAHVLRHDGGREGWSVTAGYRYNF